jgi:hypothetical protein
VSRSRAIILRPVSAVDDVEWDGVPPAAAPGASAATAAATGTRNLRPADVARALASLTGLNVEQLFQRVNKTLWELWNRVGHQDRVHHLPSPLVVPLPVALSFEAELLVQLDRGLVPREDVQLELAHA